MAQRDEKFGRESFQCHLAIYNPRRKNFPINDLHASEAQITWEFEKLRDADMIAFWFSKGSLNPIVLYELGKWGNSSSKPIIVGVDDGYERFMDVEIQTNLARPDIRIQFTLKDFIDEIEGNYLSLVPISEG